MNPRTYLMAAFLISPVWAQEPAVEAPVTAAPSYDLRGDAVQKIVRDTAATQFADVQVSDKPPVEAKPAEFVYVPAEKVPAPPSEPFRRLPEAPPRSTGFWSAVVDTLVEEALGIEDYDDVTASNDMLRCRVQKETKTGAPGVDNCPKVY
ncbi:MAG: hypothetical protein ABI821_17495 [Pseudomonadota bacterium]